MMAEELREVLEFLDDGEFRAIAIGKMEGYSNEELADQLDCSVRTIERRLGLIREKLKRKFLDDESE
jgi:DNA-directed RNA polymerase specialized sigma24 family protein